MKTSTSPQAHHSVAPGAYSPSFGQSVSLGVRGCSGPEAPTPRKHRAREASPQLQTLTAGWLFQMQPGSRDALPLLAPLRGGLDLSVPGELIMEGLTQIAVPRPPSPILPFLGWFRDADGGRGVPAVPHLCPLAAEACGRVQGEIPAFFVHFGVRCAHEICSLLNEIAMCHLKVSKWKL